MDQRHSRHGTPLLRHHPWYRATEQLRPSPGPAPVTRAPRPVARSEPLSVSATRLLTFASITLLQNGLRASGNPMTPATSPSPGTVRNKDRDLRAFTSSHG